MKIYGQDATSCSAHNFFFPTPLKFLHSSQYNLIARERSCLSEEKKKIETTPTRVTNKWKIRRAEKVPSHLSLFHNGQ